MSNDTALGARVREKLGQGATITKVVPRKAAKPKKPKRKHEARSKAAASLPHALKRADDYKVIMAMPLGSERTIEEQVFQRTYVAKELIAQEAALRLKRWIGCAYMTPLVATQSFLDAYITAYRGAWARHIDAVTAPLKRPCPESLGALNMADMTSMWKARQMADELGMPYGLFCDIIMDHWLKSKRAGRPPLPNQLTSSPLTRALMRGRPTSAEISELFGAPDFFERFKMNHGPGDDERARFLGMAHYHVHLPGNQKMKMITYLGAEGVLTRDEALSICDEETVNWGLARMGARDTLPISVDAYRPGCIGSRTTKEPCKSCEWAAECSGVKERSTKILVDLYGTTEPLVARERELSAARKRKQRSKAVVHRESGAV